jgi:hypothetical protein
MKLIKGFSLLLLLTTLLLSSCSRKKKNEAAGYIPADASAVLAINPQQLMTKLSKEGVNYQKIYNMIFGGMEDTTSTPGVFWPGAEKSGINLEQPIYVSLSIPSKITDNNAILRIIIPLNDAEKFGKTLTAQEPEIRKEGKFTFAVLDEAAYGYNNKTAIYVAHLNAESITGVQLTGVYSPTDSAGNNDELSSFSGTQAADIVLNSFNLDPKNSLATNEFFDEMPLGKNDMKIWLNYTNGVAGMLKGDASTAALVLEPLMRNSFTAALLNFENGKISGQSKMYFQKEAAETIKKSVAKEMELSLVSSFPGTQLNGFAGLALDPSLIRHILEFVKWDGNVNLALSLAGLTMNDLVGSFSGDISVIFADTPTEQFNGLSPMGMLEKANWAAVAKLNNKASLEKILASSKVQESIKKEGDAYIMNQKGSKVYFNIKDDKLFVGSNPQLLAQYMAGTAKNNFAAGPLAGFAKKPMGIYLSTGNKAAGGTGLAGLAQIVTGTLKEVMITGGKFEKNHFSATLEIATSNKDQNSLAAVFNSALAFMQQEMNALLKEGAEDDMPRLEPMQVK